MKPLRILLPSAMLLMAALFITAQEAPKTIPPEVLKQLPNGRLPTEDELASDNKLFITLAGKALKWEEPAEPVQIAGPIYFVGTRGLGAFLITTSEGHILMNTGMPSSGPMMVESIRKLGFKPEDIKLMINGHAHIDHAGAFAYFKEKFGPKLAVMKDDVAAMESGGNGDFKYGNDFAYPPAKVDQVLRDGDQVRMGEVLLTAYHTPGHTKGATTWIANIIADGKPYVVAFPDGSGFNPGYRLAKNPSYPGITEDFRRTHHFLEMLKPDIWLAQHNEYYDFESKVQRAKTEGVKAWIDPDGSSLWTRDRLGGDLFGARPALAQHGVDLRFETTGFYQGLVGGDGDHDMEFSGRTDLFLALDGQTAGLWPGFFVNIHGGYRYGDLPAKGGTLSPTNGAMISPASSGDIFALTNVVITQALSESLLVSIGKFDTIDLADRTFLGGRGVEDFMNLSFVAPPIAGRTVPASTLGTIISVLDQGKPVFNVGVIDARSPLTSPGFDGLSSDEITFLADYTFRTKLNGLDGTHTIGATFSTIDAFSIDASDYIVPPAGGLPAPEKEGDSWQINYIFEQFLCQYAGDPGKGWGVFGLLGVSDGNPNPIGFSAALGLGGKGVCAARPNDNFGVGVFYNDISDELKETLALANIPLDDDYGVEIYYDAAVTPWFRLGADLQIANPVLERRDTAVTLGLRGRLIF